MKSFVTGSRAYGTPRPDSDIDLVVLVEADDLYLLGEIANNHADLQSPGGTHYEDGESLRFGNLNLLCVTNQVHFEVWKRGTEELKARKPVTRQDAIDHLASIRRAAKISGWG